MKSVIFIPASFQCNQQVNAFGRYKGSVIREALYCDDAPMQISFAVVLEKSLNMSCQMHKYRSITVNSYSVIIKHDI